MKIFHVYVREDSKHSTPTLVFDEVTQRKRLGSLGVPIEDAPDHAPAGYEETDRSTTHVFYRLMRGTR